MSSHRRKELQHYIDVAEDSDWRVELRNGGHYAFYAPDGETMVFCASTPSDHRSLKNLRSRLRREGLDL